MSADVLDPASRGALRPTLVPDLVELAAARPGPDGDVGARRTALVEDSGRRLTWAELEDEVGMLKERLAANEREKESQRSPSKKMRVLKSRRWDGSGMGVEDVF